MARVSDPDVLLGELDKLKKRCILRDPARDATITRAESFRPR